MGFDNRQFDRVGSRFILDPCSSRAERPQRGILAGNAVRSGWYRLYGLCRSFGVAKENSEVAVGYCQDMASQSYLDQSFECSSDSVSQQISLGRGS